jgi:hypothetical protein
MFVGLPPVALKCVTRGLVLAWVFALCKAMLALSGRLAGRGGMARRG